MSTDTIKDFYDVASGTKDGERSWGTWEGSITQIGAQMYRMVQGGKITEEKGVATVEYAIDKSSTPQEAVKYTLEYLSSVGLAKATAASMQKWGAQALRSVNSSQEYLSWFDDLKWFIEETATDTKKTGIGVSALLLFALGAYGLSKTVK